MAVELPTIYQQFIHVGHYARYRDDLGRRETWEETVDRYLDFFKARTKSKKIPWDDLRNAILNLEVMPSMRSMMTAGPALEKDQVAGYNCSYLPIDNPKSFDEIMYLLSCGCGVGFSVESRYTNKLPEVPDELHDTDTTIVFKDSKLGWASGFREFISLLYSGKIAKWDVSLIRPAGARLKTFGGRASGPEPLVDLMKFTIQIFNKSRGRRLSPLECHDVVCKVADVIVSGGVRRSALISLTDLNDDKMRQAKSGNWWLDNGQRALANISAVYESKPDMETFMAEWLALLKSHSGERGIFSRKASQLIAGQFGRRDPDIDYGTNPCSEIILRPYQFCNLTEVVVRSTDTLGDLKRKVRLAAILGTLQSTVSDFRYINKKWKKNTEEERLLGVSMTGIMDHPVLNNIEPYKVNTFGSDGIQVGELLNILRTVALNTNIEFADYLGIEHSAAITCVKPSGTVSQLTDTASGIHPRYAKYYIRRVRLAKTDPLAQFMTEKGYKAEEDFYNKTNWVFSFPMEAPVGSRLVKDMTAIDQLEHWLLFQDNWCEHKPSITVYIGDDEWLEVGAWVYKHIDRISGVAFLPRDTGSYRQAPYEEITEEKYLELTTDQLKSIDWTLFREEDDNTTAAKELACSSGVCEI
jgi:ribonucleoside-triphosphate reductase (thioredoxin)